MNAKNIKDNLDSIRETGRDLNNNFWKNETVFLEHIIESIKSEMIISAQPIFIPIKQKSI